MSVSWQAWKLGVYLPVENLEETIALHGNESQDLEKDTAGGSSCMLRAAGLFQSLSSAVGQSKPSVLSLILYFHFQAGIFRKGRAMLWTQPLTVQNNVSICASLLVGKWEIR